MGGEAQSNGKNGFKEIRDFDDVLLATGGYGRWQVRNFFLLAAFPMAAGIAVVTWTFTAFQMKPRCAVSACEDPLTASYFDSSSALPPGWVPEGGAGKCVGFYPEEASDCDDHRAKLEIASAAGKAELRECPREEVIFDNSTVMHTSLAIDFDLVCGDAYLQSLLGTTYMVGTLFGSLAAGAMADAKGRRVTIAAFSALMAVTGALGALATEPISFGVLRFLTGAGGVGAIMVTFVLFVETITSGNVALYALLFNIPFAVGETILGAEAYFFRDWRTLQAVAFVPLFCLPVLAFIAKESPRWLLAVGKKEEATRVVEGIAKVNGKEVDVGGLLECLSEDDNSKKKGEENNDGESGASFADMLKSRTLLLRCLGMFYQWFCVTFCYYGLSFSSTSLSGNTYVNFCLSVFVEVPGYLFVAFFLDCWGRRPILVILQIMSGLGCIAAGLLHGIQHLAALQLCLSLVGKFGSTAAFSIVYLYTAELFPTAQRSSVTGACSTVARIGAVLSLMIQHLSDYWGPLPMVLMGGTSLLAGALAVAFPETTGRAMPDTMEQAERIGEEDREGIWEYHWERSPLAKENRSKKNDI